MKYADLIRDYIKKSYLTLDQISEKIEEKGLTASKQYLSKLQNGKTPPASEELNRAIAEITGGDPEKLVWAGYIEKAPESIKHIARFLFDEDVIETGLKLLKKYPDFFEKQNENWGSVPEYKDFKRSLYKSFFNSDEFKEFEDHYEDLNLINKIEKKVNIHSEDYDFGLDRLIHKHGILIDDTLSIPVLGHIQAGNPVLADEHIIEYISLPNPGNFQEGELFGLRVNGDSMTGSRIFPGDLVIVRIQPDVENGEIAVVNLDGENATLKRVKKLDGQIVLYPDNPKYEPIIVNSNQARICGKVIQVIFEPK